MVQVVFTMQFAYLTLRYLLIADDRIQDHVRAKRLRLSHQNDIVGKGNIHEG